MLNSFDQLFYEPIKEIKNFNLVKDNITFQDFILLYEQTSDIEDKINLLKLLKLNFSNDFSQLNICIFCSSNNKNQLNSLLIKKELDIETDLETEQSNSLYPLDKNNEYICWIIQEYFSQNNEIIKQYLNDILILIISVIGVNKYQISKIYEELSKIYFYSEQKTNINDFLKNIKFLSVLYGFKEDNTNENSNYIKSQINNKPYNYYYFKVKESIQISPSLTSIEKSKINEGISIFICFNCLLNPKYNKFINNEKSIDQSIIFSIVFNNYNKFMLFIDNEMNLIIKLYENKNNKEKLVIIDKIENNKWYNIGINLNINKKNKKYPLTIMINNNLNNNVKEIECENLKINEINNIILCENFIGFITNFILFNKII